MKDKKLPFFRQLNAMDCGPTCLRMITSYYGKHFSAESLRMATGYGKEGTSLLSLSEACESVGIRTKGVRIKYADLEQGILPAILHWNQYHFVVLYRVSGPPNNRKFLVGDPAKGMVTYHEEEFKEAWLPVKEMSTGVALLLEPAQAFYEHKGEMKKKLDWGLIVRHVKNNKWGLIKVLVTLIISSGLQLFFPFFAQQLVDKGINSNNLGYVTIILLAQSTLLVSRAFVDFLRSRILLGISSIINLSIASEFWAKMVKLPISYFDSYHTGDTLQRLNDTRKIEAFLTGSALGTFFSLLTFMAYAVVLMRYDYKLFLIFTAGSGCYFFWIRFFLARRRRLNYKAFFLSSRESNMTLQLIQGMQEIKLNNAESHKRNEWESIQTELIDLNKKNLSASQLQQSGALLINHGKDILITFFVAGMVIDGKMTLGEMLAVQYIIGQLSGPVEQFIGFIQSSQDARISMERLNDVHQLKEEEGEGDVLSGKFPENPSISINNLSFTYPGIGNEPVLRDITIDVAEGETLAIIGSSGSGKTTLLKLLLNFYNTYKGDIFFGDNNIKEIKHSTLRKNCGVVLQDGYIFNDSIANNISVNGQHVNMERIRKAAMLANILEFIESLPNGFYTHLGTDGIGISQGQRQRILIARAIYKDPPILFLDEATNSLDSNNEKAIIANLQDFFRKRTVVIVAHRLSTVKSADMIVVLDNGKITEKGSHTQLLQQKGRYYELVKNQLELDQ